MGNALALLCTLAELVKADDESPYCFEAFYYIWVVDFCLQLNIFSEKHRHDTLSTVSILLSLSTSGYHFKIVRYIGITSE